MLAATCKTPRVAQVNLLHSIASAVSVQVLSVIMSACVYVSHLKDVSHKGRVTVVAIQWRKCHSGNLWDTKPELCVMQLPARCGSARNKNTGGVGGFNKLIDLCNLKSSEDRSRPSYSIETKLSRSMSDTDDKNKDGWAVKFVPFASQIESPFWVRYCREKLEKIQLSEDQLVLQGSYGVDGSPRILCQESAFHVAPLPSSDFSGTFVANERVAVKVMLQGFNTMDSFQKCDKNKLLHDYFTPAFLRGGEDALAASTCAYLCVYPELKSHKVLYWMAVPALLTVSGKSVRAFQQGTIKDYWTVEDRINLNKNIDSLRHSNLKDQSRKGGLSPFFLCTKSRCCNFDFHSYTKLAMEVPKADIIFGFFDPSSAIPVEPEQPMGWPLRNLVAYLSYHFSLGGETVTILSYRPKRLHRISKSETTKYDGLSRLTDSGDDSLLLEVMVPTKEDYEWGTSTDSTAPKHRVVGWELNTTNKHGPRWVDLRPLLDSNHLAIQAADLNLKLMKWRMIPDLNVTQLQHTRVLMIGAGTLGCSVARVLIGWGIRKMKIVDYGKVSYSNPVRQSLFTLEDCHFDNGGGRPKAEAASNALKTIAADMESQGICLSIPMPGHPDTREAIMESVSKLEELVRECDAIFLLTDTRESRWLPTLMAASHGKILINAAMGLDSWLVMRHGGGVRSDSSEEGRLGCYFCNDVVAPENSTKNRTLDQQCTVTRPGLAPIASSMAAELLVSLLHHPKRLDAPAPARAGGVGAFSPSASHDDPSSSGPLGIIPHQIRGSLVSYTMMVPTVPAFKHCTACSSPIINAYREGQADFVFNACDSKDGVYLGNISGLTGFRAEAAGKIAEMEDWDDDDDDEIQL